MGWTIDVSSNFSVASARRFIDGILLYAGGGETRWNSWVPIKLSVLLWRIRLLSIPTRERLSYKEILLESILCPICSCRVETIEHLFSGCSKLCDIWTRIAIWWGIQIPDHMSVHSLIMRSDSFSMRGGQRKAFDAVVITCFWCIWNFTNSTIYGSTTPKKSFLFDDVVYWAFLWISSRCCKAKLCWSSWLHNPISATTLM